MKDSQINSAPILKNNIRVYSLKTKHLFSKEDQELFENFDKKMPKFSKYLKVQKESVIKKTNKIYAENSSLPLKIVIIQILSTLPDFLTGENLIKVVGYITKTWEACQTKAEKETVTPT